MNGKKRMNKSALAVSISLFLVLVLLIFTFVVSQAKRNEETILLPSSPTDTDIAPTPDTKMKDTMLQVNPENVVSVLETLQVPVYYHQTMRVTVGMHYPKAVTELELWKNGELLHAQCAVSGSSKVKSVLSDGKEAWIWYDTDFVPVSVLLRDSTLDDLLGLPGFDYLSRLKTAVIAEAGYEVLEESLQQCIVIETAAENETTEQYWIDLHTGLLQRMCIVEQDEVVYELQAGSMELLNPGDRIFDGRFCLPDGTQPFMTAE